jgi:branched-chain amino acid transport system ATP-binding protein
LVQAGVEALPVDDAISPANKATVSFVHSMPWAGCTFMAKPSKAMIPRLLERAGQAAATLSGGEQQMLAIGRGLMAQPRLMLLDEPTLGLSPLMAQQMFSLVNRLVEDGLTLLLAEQDVRKTLGAAHHAYVVENGRIAAAGPAGSMADDPRIRQAFLGL